MTRAHLIFSVPVLGAAILLTASGVSAEQRSAPQGPVVVREVRVREVRVDQPPPDRDHRHHAQEAQRPADPDVIARPGARPQSSVTSPRRPDRGRWQPDRESRRRTDRQRFYNFKPRFNTGYGVVVGYPVIYPYAYPFDPFSPSVGSSYAPAPPAPNTYSNVDSAPAPDRVAAASPFSASIACEGSLPCGGVSFEITPPNAQVFVDGVFAGTVDEFDATSAPLLLAPGDHYVEIRLAGYRSASFDVTIVAGEVTPYEGTLERLRLRTP